MDIKREVSKIESEVIEIRRKIHKHPELGEHEFETSKLVEKYLNDIGIETKRVKEAFNTGIIGTIYGDRPGKTILLRADMDALPILEELDIPFCSEVEGVMHACGHDAHTAMLLGAAKILQENKSELKGNVRLVFEPNEEVAGALKMIEGGALENPKVDASFAMHVNSTLEVGTIGMSYGAFFAEDDNFTIRVKGKSGHTSAPHECIDPILCASAIVQTAQILQTRELNPLDTTVLLFGSINGGNMHNIVPDEVILQGTLRYLYKDGDDTPQHPRKRLEDIVKSVAKTYRAQADIEYEVSARVLVNDSDFMSMVESRVLDAVESVTEKKTMVTLAGEDFCEYVNGSNIPGAMVFLGTGNKKQGIHCPLHDKNFMIDESALAIGVELHVRTAVEFLNN